MSAVISQEHQLLEAVLLELRGLRRAMERREVLSESPGHLALLESIQAIFGDAEWTCDEVILEAQEGTETESARLRAALLEVRARDARSLGVHLRGRVGVYVGGLELKRLSHTREGSRRWSVRKSR